MDAVVLALVSAFTYGAMAVALRLALARGGGAEAGTFFTVLVAAAVAAPFGLVHGIDPGVVWPFLLVGLLGPGLSQLFFTLAVREAGPSRSSVVVGTAPLFAVAIALVFLDETLEAGLAAGALLIVAGGILLVGEKDRPGHVRALGLVLALVSTIVFAIRDNVLRWLADDTDVEPGVAATATLVAGAALIAGYLFATRVPLRLADARAFAPAGVLFGISYVLLFEAYYRGPVTVVSPLVATESLWGVALSALVLGRAEGVGARLAAGAVLIVAGSVLIGTFR